MTKKEMKETIEKKYRSGMWFGGEVTRTEGFRGRGKDFIIFPIEHVSLHNPNCKYAGHTISMGWRTFNGKKEIELISTRVWLSKGLLFDRKYKENYWELKK